MLEHEPAFEGRLVRLRAWEPEDLPWLVSLFNDQEVIDGLIATWPATVDEHRERLEALAGRGDVALVIERLSDGAVVGECALMRIQPPRRSALVGVCVGAPYRGGGLGTDAVRTLCRFGFRHMNMQRIELHVLAPNERAIATYRKLGFVLEGTRRRTDVAGGRYVDDLIMGLLAEELAEPE